LAEISASLTMARLDRVKGLKREIRGVREKGFGSILGSG
jgi:hypothetical protein